MRAETMRLAEKYIGFVDIESLRFVYDTHTLAKMNVRLIIKC